MISSPSLIRTFPVLLGAAALLLAPAAPADAATAPIDRPDGAIASKPVASVATAAAPSSLRDATRAGAEARKKKDEEKDGKDAGKDGKKDGKDEDKPKEPPFEKLIKKARAIEGLFNVYAKDEEGKYLLEIRPEQLDVIYLLNPTLESGLGQAFIYPAMMLGEYPVSFRRSGKTIQLIQKNLLFRAAEGSALHGPASVAAPDSMLGRAKILSQPHPERKSVLVDMGDLFVRDLEGLAPFLKAVFQSPYQIDKEGSSLVTIRSFPKNLDFEMMLHAVTPDVRQPILYAADPRTMLFRFHYSLAELPDTGFRPRLGDDRVGHFLAVIGDYTDDRPDDPTVRYVTRWHLEKKDPAAAVSEPKEPIVFYLENSIPEEYREAVRQGVIGWNPAFEAIGFRNALVAKPQPDDPEWNAADVRYSTLRWIVAPRAGFAQGPSRIHPLTGQIFDADIRFSADMIRNVRREVDELVSPVALPLPPGALRDDVARLHESLRGWTGLFGPYRLETLLLNAAGGSAPLPALGAASRSGLPAAAGACDYALGLSHQLGLGWNLLEARGGLDDAAREQYVHDFIVHVTLHEVGHTLGFRHNFKASQIHALDDLQNAAMTTRTGLTGSVMDYVPVNLAPEGRAQGQYWQTTIGPYDRFAVEYAYKPIDAPSIEGEQAELERIASRATDPALAYATDEDTFTGSPRGFDPTSNMWDLGGDILAYYRNRTAIARELFDKLETHFNEPGMRYQKRLLVFGQGIGEFIPPILNVPKYVGGINHYRDHIGDPNGRLPYVPVTAAEQRAALDFLTREIFGPDAFRFSPSLINSLAVERLQDLEGTSWTRERNDLPLHDLVLLIQSFPLMRLYHPLTLSRINDLEVRYDGGAEPFTMAEMFGEVRGAIWSELDGARNVNSFRRNLQRQHVQTLIELQLRLGPGAPEDARTLARADLEEIRRGINAVLGHPDRPLPPAGARLDTITREHLRETRARIVAALEAGLERMIPAAPAPQG